MVKKHLTLSPDIHESLSIDIKLEGYLEKLRSEKRFQNVFKFRQELTENQESTHFTAANIQSGGDNS